jgi:type II secretory pathway component PulF
MSEKLDNIIDNLKQSSVWVRIILMVAFAVVLYPVFLVLLVLMIVQMLFVIITGESNANLRSLGVALSALSTYIFQIVQFMSYVTDTKPFPFSGFPKAENDDLNVSNEIKKDKKNTVINKKPAAKKVAKKKTASRNPTTKKSE